MRIGIELDLSQRREHSPSALVIASRSQRTGRLWLSRWMRNVAPLVVGGGLRQVFPRRAILAGLPDIASRGVAQGEFVIAVDLKDRSDVSASGKLDLPPPGAISRLSLPECCRAGREPVSVDRALAADPEPCRGEAR